MTNTDKFFESFEDNLWGLQEYYKKYRDGVFKNPDDVLDLLECILEKLYTDIIYHKTQVKLNEKIKMINTFMRSKAMNEFKGDNNDT